jgi:hypothetical protein
VAENIVIIPSGGTINFFDTTSTQTNWVIESGTLKFKRGSTTYLSMDNTYPNYRVNVDLRLNRFFINNFGNLIGAQGWLGNPQPPGPAGATGAQGAQGAQGSQGSKGATGAQGSQGPQGAQGGKGPTGNQGAQGAQGNKGAQGAQGSTGGQGAQGAQGPKGPTGAQGPTGGQGAQGAQGPAGYTGPEGPDGSGPPGPGGPKGAQGATGGQGAQGAQGPTGPTGPSDKRLKLNVEPIGESLNKILNIRGVTFQWKGKEYSNTDKKKIGFIAQEVLPYVPEVIYKNNDVYTMNYKEMIAVSIEALKEQEVRITSLEERAKKVLGKAKLKGII